MVNAIKTANNINARIVYNLQAYFIQNKIQERIKEREKYRKLCIFADELINRNINLLKTGKKACNSFKNLYTLSGNGSPAGGFAIVLCEPRQDRKVATVADL